MRTFIAIDLPENLKKEIFLFSREIGKLCDIKLVEEENLHITLLFLGRILEEAPLRSAMAELRRGKGLGKIRLFLGRVEIFLSNKRPHGIWINVEGDIKKLAALHKKIVDSVLGEGLTLGENSLRFSPHVTIGRFKKRARLRPADWRDYGEVKGEFAAEKITVFQSKLSSGGPKYSKIGEFKIK